VFLSTGISIFQSQDGKKWGTKSPLMAFDRMNYLPALGYYVAWTTIHEFIYTSSNKEVWDLHVGPPRYPFSNVVQGKGVWVIAGNGIVYWSTNLAGWSVSDIPLTSFFQFSGLQYNDALKQFVITAHNTTGLYVFQSTNGKNWMQGKFLRTSRVVNTVVSSGNFVYALGDTGLALFSEDANNWELLSGNFWTQLAWVAPCGSGEWCSPAAYKDSPQDKTVPLYSTQDGAKWSRGPNASAVVLSFIGTPMNNPSTGVYLGTDSQIIYASKDLLTWTAVFSAASQNLQSLMSLYLDPTSSKWVLTAIGPRTDELWTSSDDGNTWNRVLSNPEQTQFRRVIPLSPTKFLTVRSYWGVWFFVSEDAGVTWTNTSVEVTSVENAWLVNSKAVLHIGGANVTTASLSDLTSWTTQKLGVSASATYLVFGDTFYGIDTFSAPKLWWSEDGVHWTLSDAPYFTEKIHSFGMTANRLFGVGDFGVAISAKQD